jgi:hypothetical protein
MSATANEIEMGYAAWRPSAVEVGTRVSTFQQTFHQMFRQTYTQYTQLQQSFCGRAVRDVITFRSTNCVRFRPSVGNMRCRKCSRKPASSIRTGERRSTRSNRRQAGWSEAVLNRRGRRGRWRKGADSRWRWCNDGRWRVVRRAELLAWGRFDVAGEVAGVHGVQKAGQGRIGTPGNKQHDQRRPLPHDPLHGAGITEGAGNVQSGFLVRRSLSLFAPRKGVLSRSERRHWFFGCVEGCGLVDW